MLSSREVSAALSAELTAAMTMSCSISTSSGSTASGSIVSVMQLALAVDLRRDNAAARRSGVCFGVQLLLHFQHVLLHLLCLLHKIALSHAAAHTHTAAEAAASVSFCHSFLSPFYWMVTLPNLPRKSEFILPLCAAALQLLQPDLHRCAAERRHLLPYLVEHVRDVDGVFRKAREQMQNKFAPADLARGLCGVRQNDANADGQLVFKLRERVFPADAARGDTVRRFRHRDAFLRFCHRDAFRRRRRGFLLLPPGQARSP